MTIPRRPVRHLALLAALASLTFAACAKRKADTSADTRAMEPRTEATKGNAQSADGKPGAEAPTPADKRKVIRTGRLDLRIESYDETRDKLAALVQQAGGYIDSTQVSHHSGAVSSATIVLRLPSEGFGSTLGQLRGLGEVVSEHTDARDVTDEYVDVAARLASARVLEKRLLELVAERTGTIENVLAVERELARVRGEIEGFEGKIRQWDDQVAMSTLTLGLTTHRPEIAAHDQGLGERISDGFNASIEALRDFGSGLAIALIAILPWLVLGVPAFLIGRRLWRRHMKRLFFPVAIAHPPHWQPPAPPAPPAPPEPPAKQP